MLKANAMGQFGQSTAIVHLFKENWGKRPSSVEFTWKPKSDKESDQKKKKKNYPLKPQP